jgi:hypothetical protein
MTDRLQAGLAETKAELQRLRKRVSVGTHTVHKDLSLISLIPKWSGAETGIPLEEFLSVIEFRPYRIMGGRGQVTNRSPSAYGRCKVVL